MPGGPNSIAVIIPTYNSMKYFRETLESVFLQTLQPDEILVNDDGSTDGTPDFAERYGAEFSATHGRPVPPVRVFRRSGQRQGASRTYAAGQTECEWIAFIDHDDLWVPEKLERQMAELARTGADLCYSSLITFEQREDGSVAEEEPARVPPASQIRPALFHSTTFLPSGVVVRRASFVAAGGFATGYTIAEDWELWLRLLRAGVRFCACVEPPLVRYRIHPHNQSRNAVMSLNEAMQVYRLHVLPQYPAATRLFHAAKTRSAHESAAAQAMRFNKDPQCKWMMARSIARFPFNDLPRYKMFAHMLLKGPR
jgi:glycosyltransferase involved in cell wall biosynthesis